MEKIVQTAGRNALGDFAPEFAHYNDDVLFGENWNNVDIDRKTRCIITVVALMAQGITDSSLTFHLENAKKNGVTRAEIAAVITHAAFYAGWPKAWAVFYLAKEVWAEDSGDAAGDDCAVAGNGDAASDAATDKDAFQQQILFPIGEPNDAYAQYFVGQSYLAPLSNEQVPVHNVTFEPGCRNNWHIHHATTGGGQMLICVGGRGWYQAEGEAPVELTPGTVVNIPEGVKHWHGAAADSWMAHLAIEVPGTDASNEWLEPVSDEEYAKLG